MTRLAETLRQRWKWNADGRLAPAKRTLDRALGLPALVQAERAKTATNPNLTPAGQIDTVRKFIAGDDVGRHLYHALRSIEAMRSRIEHWRASLRPAAPDRTDAAGALLRSEMRAMLRDMSNAARSKMLLADDADPRLLQAVFEAPNVMSAINDDLRNKIVAVIAERDHPDDVREIKEAEGALELIDVSVRVAFEAVRSAGEFSSDQALSDFLNETLGQKVSPIEAGVRQEWDAFRTIAA